jgi:type IV secretion system protein VirB5
MPTSIFTPEGSNATAFTVGAGGIEFADTFNDHAQRSARTWQLVALAALLSCFVSLGILRDAVNLPKTVPVIVTVAPDGQAAYVGKVDRALYGKDSIPEVAKEWLLKRLIFLTHTWVIDADAQKKYVSESTALVQSGAIKMLDAFYRHDNPFAALGERTRSVVIDPPLKQTDRTYILYFTTSEKTRSGYEVREVRWSALMTLDVYESTVDNPLGLYITTFDMKAVN